MLINRHLNSVLGRLHTLHIHYTLQRGLELREENTREFEDLEVGIEVGAKICTLFWVISYSNFMNPISILVFLFMDS